MRVFAGRRAESPPAESPGQSAAETVVPTTGPRTQVITTLRAADRVAARRATTRRRRVLYVLTGLLAVVVGVAVAGYAPRWTMAVPAVLIVGFLVLARTMVKREQASRRVEVIIPASGAEYDATPAAAPTSVEASDVEDTMGLTAEALAEVRADQPVADEGSLWDPVPVTLPTYVTKPRARRTVRTIELTQSSGHDAADSKLARDADAARAAKTTEEKPEAAPRKAAGA